MKVRINRQQTEYASRQFKELPNLVSLEVWAEPLDTTSERAENGEPKFCRCTPSSVAHVRGCYEGWGETVHSTPKVGSCTCSRSSGEVINLDAYGNCGTCGGRIFAFTPKVEKIAINPIPIDGYGGSHITECQEKINEVIGVVNKLLANP